MHATVAMSSVIFFQAEDGIRGLTVTGVQTCALPIWSANLDASSPRAIATVATANSRAKLFRRVDARALIGDTLHISGAGELCLFVKLLGATIVVRDERRLICVGESENAHVRIGFLDLAGPQPDIADDRHDPLEQHGAEQLHVAGVVL